MKQLSFSAAVAVMIVFAGLVQWSTGQEWNQFRGPTSNGHAKANNLPIDFGPEKNMRWKAEVPGRGWSSPVVAGDQVWVTTAIEIEATGEQKQEKMKSANVGGLSAFSKVKLKAYCLDRKSGKTIHDKELFDVSNPPLINTLNSFASPTPIIDDNNVYCHFGTFGTICLNRKTGAEVWRNTEYQIDHQTGPGSSPLLHNGRLYLNFDGIDQQFLVALDASSGKQVWKTKRSGQLHSQADMQKAFATPLMIEIDGQTQLVSPGADWVYGYHPKSGAELWKIKFGQLGFSNAPQPVAAAGKIVICTGFTRSQMIAISMKGGRPTDQQIAWRYQQQVPCMSTPIVIDQLIYFVSDRGIATCLDIEKGTQKWQHRLGGAFSSSPIYADGNLFFCNRKGIVFVVEPGDHFKQKAANQLDSRIMATPVAVGDSLFIRTEKTLYHFGK